MPFIPLNVKTGYSFLSSALTCESIKRNVLKMNYEGVGISDINLHAFPEFVKNIKEINKKYLLGEEIEIDNYAISFYIMNEEGYRNLIELSPSISQFENVKEKLLKNHKGLIAILDTNNELFISKIKENNEAFRKELLDLSNIADEFYLGLNILSASDNEDAKAIRDFANKYSYQTIAFPKVLYAKKEDAIAIDIVSAIKNDERIKIKEHSGPNYFISHNAALKIYTKDEIELTNTLLNKSNFDLNVKRGALLNYSSKDDELLLKEMTYKALKDKNLDNEEYKQRLDYELDVLIKMGYASYFLIVQDYVKKARELDVLVGPGRGSAAGSLVSYLLDITEIDPIKYGLLFERFLNVARKSMPDIDMDFEDTKREIIVDYLRNRWGKEKVANIVTFSVIHAKQALRDIGRIYDFNESDINLISKRIGSNKEKLSLRDNYKTNEAFRNLIDSDKYYLEIVSLASKIEGLPRQTSIHASGVVLNNQDISKVMPVLLDMNENTITQYDGLYMEDQGFLKMDLLGLRNLTTIVDCCSLINERYPDKHIDKWNIPYDTKEIFDLIKEGKTMGVFQLESKGMRRSIKILKPECFNDVAALLALFRPGPMDNIPLYAKRKESKSKIFYPIKELEPILNETYGIIVYQEQISLIAMKVAGFNGNDADVFRRAVSKKKIDTLKEVEQKFIDGCLKNNHSYKDSKKLFDDILKFANYGFNKSHSVGYAIIACRMAYLKANYPLEFYSSILKTQSHNDDVKFSDYLKEMKESGIKILPPSINDSNDYFDIKNKSLVFPLNEINGINNQIAAFILLERKNNGEFKDYYDFIIRLYPYKLTNKIYERLIDAGSLDCFKHSRASLKMALPSLINFAKVSYDEQCQIKLMETLPKPRIPVVIDEPNEKLSLELEALDMMLSDNPLNYKKDFIEKEHIVAIQDLENNIKTKTIGIIKGIKRIATKKKETMAFVTIYDQNNEIDVTIFPKLYNSVIDSLKKNNMIMVIGKLDNSREEISFIADDIVLVEE